MYEALAPGGSGRGLTDPAALAAYNKRLDDFNAMVRALNVAYAPGEATEADWAAANVTPQQRAAAIADDLRTSARKASGNFTSNMMPLAMLAAAYGQNLFGSGLLDGGAELAGGGSELGEAEALGMGSGGDALTAGDLAGSDLAGSDMAGGGQVGGDLAGGGQVGGGQVGGGRGFSAGAGALSSAGQSTNLEVMGDPSSWASVFEQGVPSVDTGPIGGGRGMAAGAGAISNGAQAANLAATGDTSSWASVFGNNLSGTDLAKIAGSLYGAATSGSGSQFGTKEPWGPAQPWLKQNIATGQQLQDWYQKHPFNAQQKAGLQNTLTDADNFRASVLPGLLDFANGMMGGQYQRQKGGAPGAGAGYGGAVQAGGYTPGSGHVFSVAPGQRFGTIDWDAVNPFSTAVRP